MSNENIQQTNLDLLDLEIELLEQRIELVSYGTKKDPDELRKVEETEIYCAPNGGIPPHGAECGVQGSY